MSTAAQLAQDIGTDEAGRLADACGADPSRICTWVFDQTDNGFLAAATEWVVERPLKVVLIALGAFIIARVARRAVRVMAKRITSATTSDRLAKIRNQGPVKLLTETEENKRSAARAQTLSSVLSSVITAVVWSAALLMMLGVFDINIGPLLAGASIAGVAIGFGSQTIVKDFMSGLFMLIEDQFGVGDVIDVGPVTGTVEAVSLRTTTIRDVSGTVWHVPNGEVARVGNYSQLWSRALLDIEVSYDTDLRFAEGVIQRVANEMWDDPEWGGDELMEAPEVWGIQSLGASGIAIRLVVKTEPSVQWKVERELRLRIKEAFDEAGIEIPFPQRTLWLRDQGQHQLGEAPDPSTIKTVEPPRHQTVVSDADGD
ncbi:MAG: mechanosensitive ion channel family protein [Acidimicrobiia bacterium]|nr:mechanosensitive ion channel family protein [Acidimicrobiia bacterium]MYB24824.1 mechanosensitive ion channel family protein [Acidimicrobiia bacterium]MYJ14533.1 mechanosensitive ion channel family protein [Acidimicrobiia bacterium]